ncbi:hypothetical protein F5Y15DRAFT_380626 [Xylariaceae sp. FL0016]|nr:hypothetical protein F5Y15DRAFT_380626 [Xylariaceae sp. FL0016]
MPYPFHPDDFPIEKSVTLNPTQAFYLKGCIHFKTDAKVLDLTGHMQQPWNHFSHAFMDEADAVAQKLESRTPKYKLSSCGNMMRTIKTFTDGAGSKVADLNITFVSFGSSAVRFPPGSAHSRHEIELSPVDDGKLANKHEAFVRHSIPYFWDMTNGRVGILYKCLNQKRVEVGRVTGFGFDKDAVLVLNGEECDDVVALTTCIILLNGRDAMDA